jgi:hypothetical protein
MNEIKKSVVPKVLVALLVALGIQSSPASAAQVDYLEVTPNDIIAGNAAIISLRISDCSVAPTDLVLQVENASTTVNLRMNSSDFEGKLIDNAYLATWQYRGIKNRGAKVGDFSATVTGSSGCAAELGPEIASNDESYVYPKNYVLDSLDIYHGTALPSLSGIKVNWTAASDAVKYEISYAEKDSENWISAGFKTNTTKLLQYGSAVDFNKYYDVRVQAFDSRNKSGDYINIDHEKTAVARARSWTSEVGDSNRTEKTVFSSGSEVQFNLEIEDCSDPSGYEEGGAFVGEIWSGSLATGETWNGISVNEWGSADIFTNYAYEYSADKVTVSWQLDAELTPGFYTQGQYLMGCAMDTWEAYGYPYAEYTQFAISEGGLIAPPDADSIRSARKENAKSIDFKWAAPSNLGDGPFTYKIYTYINYDDRDTWKLIKTTKKKSFTYTGLRPAWEYNLAVEVSNAGGTSEFTLDGYTLPAMAKIKSTFSNAQVANLLGIPKPSKAKFKMTLEKFKFVKSTCSIKKKKLVFSKNIGLCQMSATWKENGQSNSNEIYIWSHK